jgi:arylformamidase
MRPPRVVCYIGRDPSATPMLRIHDVTVPLAPGMTVGPLDPPFTIESVQHAGEHPYGLSRVQVSTHAGTHVDAPSHFLPGGATVDQLPLEILLGKARVVEVLARERVDRADLEALDLRDDLRVLLKTRMSGQLLKGGYQSDHVYLSEDAALYLAQAGIKLVGFDYLSVDRFGSADHPAHRALLGHGVILVEGLDLSELEPGEYEMACLPLRIAGGDGAPARVVLRSRG